MTKMASIRSELTVAAYAAISLLVSSGQAAMAQSQCESVAGNLVDNCGFELRNGNNIPTGWVTGGPNGVSFSLAGLQRTGSRSLYSNFDSPGATFVNQLVGGPGTYNVSFWLDLYSQGVATNPVPTIAIKFGDQTLNVTVSVDNNQDPVYTQFQFSNITTAIPALLEFATSGNAPANQFVQYVNFLVDDVVVTLVASAVPEPSSLALGLAGLAGLAMLRRSRPVEPPQIS